MATFYWVGGAGTWDGSTTTNWASSSGGAGGAGVPTLSDNAVFDSLSNATAYAVTLGSGAVCADWTVAGPLTGNVTFAGTAGISVYGTLLWPVSGMVKSYTGTTTFASTTTGKTVTTNGLNIGSTNFDGVGGGWELGSAITATGQNIVVTNGSFSTSASNYSVTSTRFLSSNSNVRSIILNGSTVTLSASGANDPGVNFTDSTNLTFNAGTSQITLSGIQGRLHGGGNTFYNVSFTSGGGSKTLTGTNTFNNFTTQNRTVTGVGTFVFENNQIINGTFTCNNSTTAIRRVIMLSSVLGTPRTIKVNAVSLVNLDFQDIIIDPTSTAFPVTGTRLGNLGGNSGITFTTAKTVYWNLAAGGNFSATAWSLLSGGAVDINNFPLAQDTAIIENTGLNTSATITMDNPWQIGTLDISTRSNAMTFTQTSSYAVYGNFTLSSSVTLTGVGPLTFSVYGSTQVVTSAGRTFTQPVTINAFSGTVQFADAITGTTFTQSNGTVQLKNGVTSTVTNFVTSGTNQKFLRSTLAGSQATLSKTSGTVNVSNLTIQDINAVGGATWSAPITQLNIDDGNNDGWDFFVQLGQYMYTRRKNKRLLIS